MAEVKGQGKGQGKRSQQAAAPETACTWQDDGRTFSVDREAVGMTDAGAEAWASAMSRELDAHFPAGTAGAWLSCAGMNFSRNAIGDRGMRAIMRVMVSREIPVASLKLFKNRLGDGAAKAVAELLAKGRQPREVHVSHNRITGVGAVALLRAASTPSRKGSSWGSQPLWMRIENNCIDWDSAIPELEKCGVPWDACDTQRSWQGQQKRRGDAKPVQVLMHTSYTHQRKEKRFGAAVEDEGPTGEVYEREMMLFIRELMTDQLASDKKSNRLKSMDGALCPKEEERRDEEGAGSKERRPKAEPKAAQAAEGDAARPWQPTAQKPDPGIVAGTVAEVAAAFAKAQAAASCVAAPNMYMAPAAKAFGFDAKAPEFRFNAQATSFVPTQAPIQAPDPFEMKFILGGDEPPKGVRKATTESESTSAGEEDRERDADGGEEGCVQS